MNQDSSKDVIVRFSIPVKISALLITIAAIVAFLPLALQAIPGEALAAAFFFLAVPGFFAYLTIVIFTYRLQIGSDRIVTEAFPNPFVRSRQCLFAEISGIEKDKWWSSLSIFRYRIPDSFRITNLETRDAGPMVLLEAVQTRIGRNIFLERVTKSLRVYWKWHTLLVNSILLLGSAWLSIQILRIGGVPDIPDAVRETILVVLFSAAILLALADMFIYRLLNRDN
jgi:hypothetical protein